MIHGLAARLRSLDASRVVGLLALVAIVALLLAGGVHDDGAGHDDHACSLCFAVIASGGASVPAPASVELPAPREIARRAERFASPAVAHGHVRLPAPRGPPVLGA